MKTKYVRRKACELPEIYFRASLRILQSHKEKHTHQPAQRSGHTVTSYGLIRYFDEFKSCAKCSSIGQRDRATNCLADNLCSKIYRFNVYRKLNKTQQMHDENNELKQAQRMRDTCKTCSCH